MPLLDPFNKETLTYKFHNKGNGAQFQTDVAPEPYYGYLHEDMTNDVLLLLLNPGAKDERTKEQGWNKGVRNRYVKRWSMHEYRRQEEILKGKNKWRDKRLNQARGIVGEVGFYTRISG